MDIDIMRDKMVGEFVQASVVNIVVLIWNILMQESNDWIW